jgi:hypothetical protein
MFRVEYPGATSIADEQAQAAFRAAMEPVVEIYQHKGDSECRSDGATLLGPPDELCGFEWRTPFPDCAMAEAHGAALRLRVRRDFVRGALLEGLAEADRIGVNPFTLGFIGGTDTHNGTPGDVDGDLRRPPRHRHDIRQRLSRGTLTVGGIRLSPGGSPAPNRKTPRGHFRALRRREVCHQRSRITPAFFAGWDLPGSLR